MCPCGCNSSAFFPLVSRPHMSTSHRGNVDQNSAGNGASKIASRLLAPWSRETHGGEQQWFRDTNIQPTVQWSLHPLKSPTYTPRDVRKFPGRQDRSARSVQVHFVSFHYEMFWTFYLLAFIWKYFPHTQIDSHCITRHWLKMLKKHYSGTCEMVRKYALGKSCKKGEK